MAERNENVFTGDELEWTDELGFPYEIEKKAVNLFFPGDVSIGKVKNPASRDGIGFKAKQVSKFALAGWRYTIGATAMEMKEHLDNAIAEANDAQKRLSNTLVKFRSSTKNDLSSMEALGKQIRNEMNRIQDSMNKTMDLMVSAPMVEAIENAGRLAAALESIDKLKSSRVSFSIIDMPTK